MNFNVLITSILLAMPLSCFSQSQLPNSDFEDIHTLELTVTYGDPSDPETQILDIEYDSLGQGWTSGNPINRFLPIEHVFMKDTSFAHSGNHAIVMRTDSIGPVVAVGNVGLGTFDYNEDNPFNSILFGVPFADRPTTFEGWYTYKSVGAVAPDGDESLINGDSLLISCFLTKWNSNLAKRDTVAFTSWTSNETVEDYTNFVLFFHYFSDDMPDSANVMMLSSSLGYVADFSQRPYGVKGSTLVVDDLNMNYSPVGLEHKELDASVYAYGKTITIEVLDENVANSEVEICDVAGRTLHLSKLNSNTLSVNLSYSGVVFVVVTSQNGSIARKLFID